MKFNISKFFNFFKRREFNYKLPPQTLQLAEVLRSFIKKNKSLLILVAFSFFVADLLNVYAYRFVIPEKDLAPVKSASLETFNDPNKYQNIWTNNIFHDGEIPTQLLGEDPLLKQPVLSQLSLDLKGTIVHANPKKSVATLKNLKGDIMPYALDDVIDNQAKVTKIERGKIIFFNQNNNQLEYIVLPKDDNLAINYQTKREAPKPTTGRSLVRRNGNNFQVSRSDINSHLNRLHEILQDALVIPHYEDGRMLGYKFDKIKKGSVYEDLGFTKGDIIKSVNGEAVRDPQKAMELYQSLKNDSELKMLVIRDGKEVELNYKVDENSPIN